MTEKGFDRFSRRLFDFSRVIILCFVCLVLHQYLDVKVNTKAGYIFTSSFVVLLVFLGAVYLNPTGIPTSSFKRVNEVLSIVLKVVLIALVIGILTKHVTFQIETKVKGYPPKKTDLNLF